MARLDSAPQVSGSQTLPITKGLRPTVDPDQTVYIQPKSLMAVETLVYETRIGPRADTTIVSSKGKVEICVPYDGTECFGPDEVEKAKKNSLSRAVCGFVGIERPDAGPMDRPIKIPVQINCDDLDQYIATGSEATMSVEYTMPETVRRVISVEAMLLDDIPGIDDLRDSSASFTEHLRLYIWVRCHAGNISRATWQLVLDRVEKERKEALEEFNRQKKLATSQSRSESEIETTDKQRSQEKALSAARDHLDRLTRLSGSLKQLESDKAVEFTAEAISDIIADVKRKDKDQLSDETRQHLNKLDQFVMNSLSSATLTYAGIEWPYTERGANTTGSGNWQYNPETRRLEQWDIPMKWNRKAEAYEAILLLNLYQPAEDNRVVRGQVVLEIDQLVSGMTLTWIDGNEEINEEAQPIRRTVGICDIQEIQLPDIFYTRPLFPRRRLVFKHVLPTLERLREIESVLCDAGLTILSRSYGADIQSANLGEGCWLTATQRQIGLPMQIGVAVHGEQESGRHTVIYDGRRQRLEADVPIGDLRVELFAQIVGAPSVISGILDDLQIRLQNVFKNASSMAW